MVRADRPSPSCLRVSYRGLAGGAATDIRVRAGRDDDVAAGHGPSGRPGVLQGPQLGHGTSARLAPVLRSLRAAGRERPSTRGVLRVVPGRTTGSRLALRRAAAGAARDAAGRVRRLRAVLPPPVGSAARTSRIAGRVPQGLRSAEDQAGRARRIDLRAGALAKSCSGGSMDCW